MNRRSIRRRLVLTALPFAVACGQSLKTSTPVVTPANKPVAATSKTGAPAPVKDVKAVEATVPVVDPVAILLAEADRHLQSGLRQVELGHVESARQAFDAAVNVLIESPYGGRTEPRIRDYFDQLIDRISASEVKALAQGDGFTEKGYETAPIDDLLALSSTVGEPAAPSALHDVVAADLQTNGHDIAIPLNPRVLFYIEVFQGRLHDFIEEGLRRGSKYLPMIQTVFRAESLPLDLAYVPLIESAFKPNALSKANAKGVWQFMRGTGLENGLRQDWYIDERSDPEKATVAAARYLGTLAKLFDGDWHLALASYNGGPGRLQKALKKGRMADFWELAEQRSLLPRETREYVPMILAAVIIARNPAQYGFSVAAEPPQEYETVTLPRPVDLRRVAEWTDTTIDRIQALNPELRRWTTPVRDTAYELRVPAGTASVVTSRLNTEAEGNLASLNWYTVKKGETLTLVARQLRVSRTDLAEANYLKLKSPVSAGQRLVVPRQSTVLMAVHTDRPIPLAESRPTTRGKLVLAVGSPSAERVKLIYKVREGDTLASIARAFRTSVAALQSWNHIASANIRAGDRLTILKSTPAN